MGQEEKRGKPEALLRKADREKKGRLTVFFGAAAGVGKTYAMLQAAKEQLAAGRDLVIGWVDTHDRQETQAMAAGLPALPPCRLAYRGKEFLEMDLDAILLRQPQIVLVDELAHTNVRGARHIRRYQDVEEILAAGIEVYTTLNVQHIESLKDIVEHITGIRIWETVPDAIMENADRVQLIDIAPQDLQQRLQEGKVYTAAQAGRALKNFFREGNISALRELALRYTAQRVDQQMDEYMQVHDIAGPWPATEKVMVCVSASPFSAWLIRAAKRMAAAQKTDWYALHIQTGARMDCQEEDQERLRHNLQLAEELGGIVVTRTGQDIVSLMLDFAREKNVTHILIGKPLRWSWRDWLHGGDLVDRLIRQSCDVQIHVIHGQKAAETLRRIRGQAKKSVYHPGSYLWGVGMLVLVTLLCQLVGPLQLVNTAMLYLLPVLFSAFWFGRGPAYFTAVCSVVIIDLLYIPPLYSISISDMQFLWTGLIFLLVGFVAGGQTEHLRREIKLAEDEGRRTQTLYEFSREMAGTVDLQAVGQKLVQTTGKALQRDVAVFLPDAAGRLTVVAQTGRRQDARADEPGVAAWVFSHGQPAGKFTDTVPAAEYMYIPLVTQEKTIGVLALRMVEDRLPPDQSRLIKAWTCLAALAVERIALTREAGRAALLAESERLSGVLLNSISHELKTPLAAILGSVSTLQDPELSLAAAVRSELYDSIKTSSMRMERIVSNLLDTARLESGTMKVKKDWCDMQDIVGVALQHLHEHLGSRIIHTHIPAGLPLVRGDCVLLEQVLVNLLDNANKYSPGDQPIDITVAQKDGKMIVSVADYGPCIPVQEQGQIFRKFYRGSGQKTVPGTGLGLSICQGIMEAHGGAIWVINMAPQGKRFIFTLPEEENDG